MSSSGAQIYIGGLRGEVQPEDLKHKFKQFGPMAEFSYKGRYAFIQYEDAADASKAIKEMDDKRISGVRIAVELASKFHCPNLHFLTLY